MGSEQRRAPMAVAAIALLFASGRSDFSENEVLAEVERLASELRSRYGFESAQEDEAMLLFLRLRRHVRPRLPESTYRLWVKPVRPIGLAGGRLWLTAPVGVVAWCSRRYTGLFERGLRELEVPDVDVAWLGLEDRR